MFARKPNNFADFSGSHSKPLPEVEIKKRYLDFRKYLKTIHQYNLNRRAQLSATQFEKTHKMADSTFFPIGTHVMVKNQNKTKKLDPPFVGPFVITKFSKSKSAVLKDLNGLLLPRNIPIHQLKKVIPKDEEEQHFYVEGIVAHKLKNDKMLYRVRWHGYPPESDTWEPAEAFDDPSIVSNYLSRASILEEGNVSNS